MERGRKRRGLPLVLAGGGLAVVIAVLLTAFGGERIVRAATPHSPALGVRDTRPGDRTATGETIRPSTLPALRAPRFPEGGDSKPLNWTRTVNRIKARLNAEPGSARVGLIIKDLNRTYQYSYNPDVRFASASMVKIPLVITLLEECDKGRIDPHATPLFEERQRAGGSGVLKGEASGRRVYLRDLIYYSLAKSDNTATNILTDLVGMKTVTRTCIASGWKKTDMVRGVMQLDLRPRGVENWTTARDMARMMEAIYRGKVVDREVSDMLLEFMLNPPIGDRLPRRIPNDIDVVHKTGLIHDNAHDVGILYLPGNQPVLVSAFVDNIGVDYRKAKHLIGDIAKILYEETVNVPNNPNANR